MALCLDDYRNKLLIASGDWRSELSSRGWSTQSPFEQANITKPDMVREIADAFLVAGAEVLVTNTTGASELTCVDEAEAGRLDSEKIMEINRRGAEICRAAVAARPGESRLVFGAVGPTERLLLLEEIEEKELADAYAAQVRALADGGVDAIICRGFREMGALCVAVRSARNIGLPVIGCMVFDCGADYTETSLGATIPQACEALAQAGAAGVGCEGGDCPDTLPAALAEARKRWKGPIWAEVGAGTAQWIDGKVDFSEGPAEFASRLAWLQRAGANFVGGSRGAGVQHITAMVEARKALN